MHWCLQQNWAQNYCFAVTCNKTSPFIGCSQNLRASKTCNWNSCCCFLFIFHILKCCENWWRKYKISCTSEKCVAYNRGFLRRLQSLTKFPSWFDAYYSRVRNKHIGYYLIIKRSNLYIYLELYIYSEL